VRRGFTSGGKKKNNKAGTAERDACVPVSLEKALVSQKTRDGYQCSGVALVFITRDENLELEKDESGCLF
jgi:hypothetical protein